MDLMAHSLRLVANDPDRHKFIRPGDTSQLPEPEQGTDSPERPEYSSGGV